MASTFDNDLRLEEMATGENAGSWGTKTNTNLELIADAFGYGTFTIANADTTLTIPDGSGSDNALRSLYLKISSSADLTTTRVLTIDPNTVSKLWYIENNTSGGQTITISQGSGANVSILNGQAKLVATNGAGATAAVIDLTDDLAIKDLFVDENISMQSDGAAINFGTDAEIQLTHVADTGLLLTETGGGAPTLQFRDSALSISSSADGQLDIDADTEVEITATTVDINAAVEIETSLNVDGGITGDGLTIAGIASIDMGASTGTGLIVDSDNDAAVVGPHLKLNSGRGNTAAYNFLTVSNSDGNKLLFDGRGGLTVTPSTNGAAIFNSGSADADFKVYSSTNTNALWLDAGSDQLAVGTASPKTKAVFSGTSGSGSNLGDADTLINQANRGFVTLENLDNTGGVESGIIFRSKQDGAAAWAIYAKQTQDYIGDLMFRTRNGGTSSTEFMRLRNGSRTVEVKDTRGSATAGPTLDLFRESPTPADSDYIGVVNFSGENSASEIIKYANINVQLGDVTDGTEDGTLSIQTIMGGTVRDRVNFRSSGVVFNDEAQDTDFRVESSNKTGMLFVDSSADQVVITGGGSVSGPSTYRFISYADGTAGRSAFVHAAGDGGVVISGSAGGSQAALIMGNDWGTDGSGFTEEWRIMVNGSDDTLEFKHSGGTEMLAMGTNGVESKGYLNANYYYPENAGAHSSDKNGNWWKLGTLSGFGGSESAEITMYGAQSYSAGSNVAGKTTMIMRANNSGTTIEAFYWSETNGNDGVQNVCYKATAGSDEYEIYVKVSTFFGFDNIVCSAATWTPGLSDTGSTTIPTSSVPFETQKMYQMGSGDKRWYLASTSTIHNYSSIDRDFKAQTPNESNAFIVDAGNDKIGIASGADASFNLKIGDSADEDPLKLGSWYQVHIGIATIHTSDTRWYKLVNYTTSIMFMGEMRMFAARFSGAHQTNGAKVQIASFAGYNGSVNTGDIATLGSAGHSNYTLEIGNDDNLYLKVPSSIYGGQVRWIMTGSFGNWQYDGSYVTTQP